MPSAAPANDVRVRTPVSLPGLLETLDLEPPEQSSHMVAPAATTQGQQSAKPTTTSTTTATTTTLASNRPALNRNVVSHTSVGTDGTDGSTHLQSDDGSGGTPDFGDTIDSTTFEQVCPQYIIYERRVSKLTHG